MANKKNEIKRELKRIERTDPALFHEIVSDYLKRGLDAFSFTVRTKTPRPGRHGSGMWCVVTAYKNVYQCGTPKAVAMVFASGKYEDRAVLWKAERDPDTGEVVGVFHREWFPRDAASFERDYNEANRRYKSDPEFREECDFWYPAYELSVRDNINLMDAINRLGMFDFTR